MILATFYKSIPMPVHEKAQEFLPSEKKRRYYFAERRTVLFRLLFSAEHVKFWSGNGEYKKPVNCVGKCTH